MNSTEAMTRPAELADMIQEIAMKVKSSIRAGKREAEARKGKDEPVGHR